MLTWIITLAEIKRIQNLNRAGAALADAYFNHKKTYVIVGGKAGFSGLPEQSVATLNFSSYHAMSKALKKKLDPRVKAVVLEMEQGDSTPKKERRHYAHYYELAAKLAHQHHLQFIAAPAVNLVKSIEPRFNGYEYLEFNRLEIPQKVAKNADIFEVQAQDREVDRDSYREFVSQASVQAKSVNPHLVVLAGLSTDTPNVTSDQLFADVMTTRGEVAGYGLSSPGSGSTSGSELAARFLRKLLRAAQR